MQRQTRLRLLSCALCGALLFSGLNQFAYVQALDLSGVTAQAGPTESVLPEQQSSNLQQDEESNNELSEGTVDLEETVIPEVEPSAEPTPAPYQKSDEEQTATPTPEVDTEPITTQTPQAILNSENDAEPTATPSPEPSPEVSKAEGEGELLEVLQLLESGSQIPFLDEEKLIKLQAEIETILNTAQLICDDEDSGQTETIGRLSDMKVAVDDMLMAYQAQREGWLDQIPQTGQENSWRYQNGQEVETDQQMLDMDVPDGVEFFSRDGYWGIDVSHHQGVINWDAVKAAGVQFAIIRCGYGMDLPEQDDSQWRRNVAECERLGIPYGVYFYSYAVTSEMAVEEGMHAVRLLEGCDPDLPVFYDMEENRQLVVGNSGLAEMARIFTDIVSSKGYEVGVYASRNWWNYYLTDPVFDNWYRWVADWNPTCGYNGRYEAWQYTSKGSVSGINGNVDLNYWYASLDSEQEKDYASIYNYDYYVSHNVDLAGYSKDQAFQHFLQHGMPEGRQASEEFNVFYYRANNPDLADSLGNDLTAYYIHYKDHGKQEGRDGRTYAQLTRYNGQDYSAVYDRNYYLENNPDLSGVYVSNDYYTIQHFVEHGMAEGRQGCENFNAFYYRANNPDLADWLGNNLKEYYIHYQAYGKSENRDGKTYACLTRYNGQDYSAVYDRDYYLKHNTDLDGIYASNDYYAIQHFVEHGMSEGRQGCENFNAFYYRANNPDLSDWLGNNLKEYYIHYQVHGKEENRDGKTYARLTRYNGQDYSAVYDRDYYLAHNTDLGGIYVSDDYYAIQHFVEHGMSEGRQGSEEFNVYSYRIRYDDLRDEFGDNLIQYYLHYINIGKENGLNGRV